MMTYVYEQVRMIPSHRISSLPRSEELVYHVDLLWCDTWCLLCGGVGGVIPIGLPSLVQCQEMFWIVLSWNDAVMSKNLRMVQRW